MREMHAGWKVERWILRCASLIEDDDCERGGAVLPLRHSRRAASGNPYLSTRAIVGANVLCGMADPCETDLWDV